MKDELIWASSEQDDPAPLPRDTRLNPQGAVTRSVTERQHGNYELDILPCQGTQVEIDSEIFAIILFAECPEIVDKSIGELIVHSQEHSAGSCAEFTANNRLEAVSALNFEGRINRADIAVIDILRDQQQTGTKCGRTVFKS